MKRCETSLTRSGPRRADGSRPYLVQAPMPRTLIICTSTSRCTEQVIAIASVNDVLDHCPIFCQGLNKRDRRANHACASGVPSVMRAVRTAPPARDTSVTRGSEGDAEAAFNCDESRLGDCCLNLKAARASGPTSVIRTFATAISFISAEA